MYNHRNKSKYSVDDCADMVGKRAELTLTGAIVGAGESDAGGYIKFKPDERWGFVDGFVIIMDADPFKIQE